MKLNRILSNKFVLSLADRITSQKVMSFYRFYSDAQWWSRDELINYQNKKLKDLVNISYSEVPLYRNLYSAHNVSPLDINTVDDIVKLPIVSKELLKSGYPDKSTRKSKFPAREYFTSGSSGNPFAVLVDNLSMSQARALMLLRANYGGWQFGDSVLQTGMSLQRGIVKKMKDIVLGISYVSAFDLSNDNLDKYIDLLFKKKIKFLMGYPGSIYALADRAREKGQSCQLQGIITWGDNLYDHFRKKIEDQFQCRVTDTYGCGEGIQVAAQCPEGHGGYHVFMPHVIVEIVDDAGNPVNRGDLGNILLTKLEPGAMPLIRYRVGDVGRLSKSQKCSCGRGYEVLDRIEGRDSDFIYTPNGNKLIVHFFTGIFEYFPQIKEFCVIQDHVSKLTIQYVPEVDFSKEILKKIDREIKSKGDPSLNIEYEPVDSINHRNGKRKFVRLTPEFKKYLKGLGYDLR